MNEDRIKNLERLAALRSSGAISDSEYEVEKKKLLNSGSSGLSNKTVCIIFFILLLFLLAAYFAFSASQNERAYDDVVVAGAAEATVAAQEAQDAVQYDDPVLSQPAAQPEAVQLPEPREAVEKVRYPVPPKIDGDWRSLRTRIRNGWGTEPTFGNRYVIIRVGCGTGCTSNIVGDHHTGEIYSLGLGGEGYDQLELMFDNSSNYLTAKWGDISTQTCVVQRFRWTGTELVEANSRQTSERVDFYCP